MGGPTGALRAGAAILFGLAVASAQLQAAGKKLREADVRKTEADASPGGKLS